MDPELKALQDEYYTVEGKIEGLNQELDDLEEQMEDRRRELVAEALGADFEPVFSSQRCANSPTGECVFDDDNADSYDECVFCGESEELSLDD